MRDGEAQLCKNISLGTEDKPKSLLIFIIKLSFEPKIIFDYL